MMFPMGCQKRHDCEFECFCTFPQKMKIPGKRKSGKHFPFQIQENRKYLCENSLAEYLCESISKRKHSSAFLESQPRPQKGSDAPYLVSGLRWSRNRDRRTSIMDRLRQRHYKYHRDWVPGSRTVHGVRFTVDISLIY